MNIFSRSIQYLKEHYFQILVGFSIAILLIISLYRIITGKKGTWATEVFYPERVSARGTIEENLERIPTPKSDSKGEIECRRVLQKIFNKPFNKIRPNFLNNTVTGGLHNLELDAFDKDIKLAVEYQGKQHYQYIPFFHKNKEAFLNQKYRDYMKQQLCKENGVHLIEVPYTVKIEDIEEYIIKKLNQFNYIN